MDIHEFLENMPPELYFWLHDEVDGGDLEPFIMYYQNRAKERSVKEHQELFKIKEGVKTLLENIQNWKAAPVWTPESIKEATKVWFKLLDKKK